MIFPVFTMPCLHSHHQPPHVLHSRDPHDGQISSSAAIGLAVGLTLIAVVVAALVYFWCWRQQDRHKKHRRRNSESRHRRESQQEHTDHVTSRNGHGAAEMEQTSQRQDAGVQNEQEPPLPAVPLSVHHHQHDDRHFHGGHHHDHHQEDDHILDRHDHSDDRDPHGNSHRDRHGLHHRHRHHRFHRTHQLLLPRDPIAEFEKLMRPLSPGISNATRADLEAILNGLDIPLPNEPARTNGRADANVNEQGAVRCEEEPRERRKKRHHHHHRHHCHRRHKRVAVH